MKAISLLYFEITLLIHLVFFLWDILKVKLGTLRYILLGALSIFTCVLLFFFLTLPFSSHQKEEPTKIDIPPARSELYTKKYLTRKEIELELSYWENILETQPSHRDILVNISQLYKVLGDDNQSVYYWGLARKADPNHEIFK